ncbi:MAG: GTP cyclohydrolase II [Saprospiraceae bacterium]|nr:GTP cyclohydrolase II [Saprospiraceae bacterium]HMW38919.1 GTP cyclohydrolase II [Saprospiraceae bacterium]HMX88099.1 GTP cyclohydrolase II [Saprospiraceae bacterium]HMZ38934.1 GTP cyclohydrolase II [Saprospiraceae bacterium]HNA65387.1 GTP cyclohydrolase II [Saprospiraceae bacterium]
MNDKFYLERPGAQLPTDFGPFKIYTFPAEFPGYPNLLLLPEEGSLANNALVRIHSECLTGDVFASRRCDCGYQLHSSLQRIAAEGGALIYLRQEGRGIGLEKKIEAYTLQDMGMDTVEANLHLGHEVDERNYGQAVHILQTLSLSQIRLLSNNPLKKQYLEEHGIHVTEMIPVQKPVDHYNERYLHAKKYKLGHLLP